MSTNQRNMSLTGDASDHLNALQKIGTVIGLAGLAIIVLSLFNDFSNKGIVLTLALTAITVGILLFARGLYHGKLEGIKNHGVWFKSMSGRGYLAWIAGVALTGFYVVLYFYAGLLGLGQGADGANTGLIGLFDPLSYLLKGSPASEWFVYGTLYTIAIVAFGVKFIWKYRHNKYQKLRTYSVMLSLIHI